MLRSAIILYILVTASYVCAQRIERIFPKPGYYTWKNISFSSNNVGYAYTETGRRFDTNDGGKTWRETTNSESQIVSPSPELIRIPLAHYTYGGTKDFIGLSKIADTLYAGRFQIYNPYILQVGKSGRYIRFLNGVSMYSLSAVYEEDNYMVIADSYGNIHYSADNGLSFATSRLGLGHTWPDLIKKGKKLFYIDDWGLTAQSDDHGKTWGNFFHINYPQKNLGAYFHNDSVRYFLCPKELMALKDKGRSFIAEVTLEKDSFVKLQQLENSAVALTQRGSIFYLENEMWKKKVVDSTAIFRDISFDKNHIAICSDTNVIYVSNNNAASFEKIILPRELSAEQVAVYGNYLFLKLFTFTPSNSGVVVYNFNTKSLQIMEINTNKLGYLLTGFYKNYILGTGGSLHRVILD